MPCNARSLKDERIGRRITRYTLAGMPLASVSLIPLASLPGILGRTPSAQGTGQAWPRLSQ